MQLFGLTIATMNLSASPFVWKGQATDRESGWQMDCFEG